MYGLPFFLIGKNLICEILVIIFFVRNFNTLKEIEQGLLNTICVIFLPLRSSTIVSTKGAIPRSPTEFIPFLILPWIKSFSSIFQVSLANFCFRPTLLLFKEIKGFESLCYILFLKMMMMTMMFYTFKKQIHLSNYNIIKVYDTLLSTKLLI